jgi:hypothetical protein
MRERIQNTVAALPPRVMILTIFAVSALAALGLAALIP